MDAVHFPHPENPYVLRATQDGDLFILLAPANEHPQLVQHQKMLQASCGGIIAAPVHVTAQRFEDQEGICIQELSRQLRAELLDFPPFPIHAVSYRSIFSPYRQGFILKWVAEVSNALQDFSYLVEKALNTAGYRSLYQSGWVSSWITALECIDCSKLPIYLDNIEIPDPLFVGSQVITSRINGQNDYLTLDQFALNSKP